MSIRIVILYLTIFCQFIAYDTLQAQEVGDLAQQSLSQISENGKFKLTIGPFDAAPIIGEIQQWQVKIEAVDGKAIDNAEFIFDARMPEHRHGLPTRPRLERKLGGGEYRVSGVKFSMPGFWLVKIDGSVGSDSLYAEFELHL